MFGGFRTATGTSRLRHTLVTILFTIVTWGLAFALAPWGVVTLEKMIGVPTYYYPAVSVSGIAVFIFASFIGLSSCVAMAWFGRGTPMPSATASNLVIVGPYKWIRNPMTLSGLLQGLGVGLWWGSVTIVVAVVIYFLIWNWCIRPAEERFLEQQFGDAYRAYKERVHAWRPF